MESFHDSGRNRLTGVQLMTRIQKRVFLELWWGDWGRTPALSKSSIGRDDFRARWSEEDCQLSTRGRVLGVSWESMQRTVTRRGDPTFRWAVKMAPEVSVGAHSWGPSSPPFWRLSRVMSHMCPNFKVWRRDGSLTLDSPSLVTIQTPEWHLVCVPVHTKKQSRAKLTLKPNVSPVYL